MLKLPFAALGALFAFAAPLAAQEASLAQMYARDRLAAPEPELAAWQAFARPVLADPGASPLLQAQSRSGLAIAHFYAKNYQQGWEHLSAALDLIGQMPEPPGFAAETLGYGALLLVELGRTSEAEEMIARAQALAEARGGGGLRDLALVRNVQGGIAFARNDLDAAEDGFCTARDLGLQAPDPNHAMIVNDASSCGVVKFYLERPDTLEALRFAREHAFAHLPADHPKMGNVLNSAYAVLLRYGRYGEAEPLIRRHLELERSLHSGDSDDIYDPLSMLGRALELSGRYDDAEGILRAASEMADRLDMRSQPYRRGMARTNLARVIARQGRIEDAVAQARAGLDRLQADLEPADYNIGSGQVQLADHLARLGRKSEALVLVEQGLAGLEGGLPEGHSERLAAQLVRARILAELGRTSEALPIARRVAANFETQMFDLVASETEKVALSAILPAAFSDYVAIALAAGEMEDAVHAAQLHLLSELAVPNARIAAAAIARSRGLGDVVERVDAARAQVAALESELAQAQAEGKASGTLTRSIAIAREEAARLQADLLEQFPDFVALARPQVSRLAQLQEQLGEGDLLVLPLILPDRAVTLAISASDVAWGETQIAPLDLEQLAGRVRSSAEYAGAFDYAAARTLFEVAFPGATVDALARARRLLFPASGYLARISPAVLLAGEADPAAPARAPWLVRSHAIGIWADTGVRRDRDAAAAGRGFLGIGAPTGLPAVLDRLPGRAAGGIDLPPLPAARRELEDLARALEADEPRILAAGEATEARLSEEATGAFGVIAFATHGLAGGQLPGLSEPALLLTPEDGSRKDRDGLLTASEIAALRLDADWVILSACETSAGDGAGAPLYSGLARAFVQAGARSLMLSHWRVRDDAASFLSVETVRRATGGADRAEALRQAQLALMARNDIPDAAHPSVWAPFVIVEN